MGTIKQWKTQTKSGTCISLQVLLSGEQLNSTAIAVRGARKVDKRHYTVELPLADISLNRPALYSKNRPSERSIHAFTLILTSIRRSPPHNGNDH